MQNANTGASQCYRTRLVLPTLHEKLSWTSSQHTTQHLTIKCLGEIKPVSTTLTLRQIGFKWFDPIQVKKYYNQIHSGIYDTD